MRTLIRRLPSARFPTTVLSGDRVALATAGTIAPSVPLVLVVANLVAGIWAGWLHSVVRRTGTGFVGASVRPDFRLTSADAEAPSAAPPGTGAAPSLGSQYLCLDRRFRRSILKRVR